MTTMRQPTAQFNNYILPKLRAVVAPIDNLVFDELGQAVLRIHNERFRSVPDIKDTTPYKPNELIFFSNMPQALSYNQIIHQLTNGRIAVASPVDVVHYWDDIPERDTTTHAFTDSVSLFSIRPGDYNPLAQRVFELLGKTATDMPLRVSGLGVKADSTLGFTLTATELTQA